MDESGLPSYDPIIPPLGLDHNPHPSVRQTWIWATVAH